METKEVYEFIFEGQIENSKRIESVGPLKGKSVFGKEYEIGQKILMFLEMTKDSNSGISLSFQTFLYPKEFEKFIDQYKFFEMKQDLPVFVRIDNIVK